MKKLININCIVGLFLVVFPLNSLNSQVLGLELLDGSKHVDISFNFSQGFILLNVKFNNSLPLKFILDTGAEHIILFDKAITDILGIEYDKRIKLIGSDLEKEVFALISRNIFINLENCKNVKRDIIVLEDDFLHLEEITGEAIHGILGSRFFRGLVLDIDYQNKKLKLIDGSKFDDKAVKNYEKIDLNIVGHKPYFNTTIVNDPGDTIALNLLVDTGSALAFLLFMNSHPSLTLPEEYIRGNLGKGLGGDLEGFLSRVKHLKINESFSFDNLIANFQDIPDGVEEGTYRNRNGLIGNPILSRFHVVIDFVRAKLYLKPNSRFDDDFKYDRSGLTIYAFGKKLDEYYVKNVLVGSPAYEAGIRNGDLIKRIGFWPAHLMTLGGIIDKFQKKEGKKIKLVMERNSERFKTTIILRDLLKKKT